MMKSTTIELILRLCYPEHELLCLLLMCSSRYGVTGVVIQLTEVEHAVMPKPKPDFYSSFEV